MELKPCRCGATYGDVERPYLDECGRIGPDATRAVSYRVICTNCQLSTGHHESKADAVTAWADLTFNHILPTYPEDKEFQ